MYCILYPTKKTRILDRTAARRAAVPNLSLSRINADQLSARVASGKANRKLQRSASRLDEKAIGRLMPPDACKRTGQLVIFTIFSKSCSNWGISVMLRLK